MACIQVLRKSNHAKLRLKIRKPVMISQHAGLGIEDKQACRPYLLVLVFIHAVDEKTCGHASWPRVRLRIKNNRPHLRALHQIGNKQPRRSG